MAGLSRNEASSSSTSGNNRVWDWGITESSFGYCRSPGITSITHDLWADSLTVDDYQDRLDRGWRRSGCLLYKPDMQKTCCPSYTIRLKAASFVPSKEQNRLYRRMERYLDGTWDVKKQDQLHQNPSTCEPSCLCSCHEASSAQALEPMVNNDEDKCKSEQLMQHLSVQVDKAVQACVDSGEIPSDIQLPNACVKGISLTKKKKLVEGSEDLLYTSNVAFWIAAALRRIQSAQKNEGRLNSSTEENGSSFELSPKDIAEKLSNSLSQLEETPHLLIRACNGHINFYSIDKQLSKVETILPVPPPGESSTRNCKKRKCLVNCSKCSQGKRRKLEILLKRSSFDPEEYNLYRRYQLRVHNDDPNNVSECSYRMFLVDTPLVFVPSSGDTTVPPSGFGSFHQQYIIDGRLVAVGVIDILPRCLSSKYRFWDPDFAFLSLGKYAALQEINWVRENQVTCPSLQYYYLGYYIHSCSKMRYKAAYRPSDLLCPLRYMWVPFDRVKTVLDKQRYAVLSDYLEQNGEPSASPVSENTAELQHDVSGHEDMNHHNFEDDEIVDLQDEDSDEESAPENEDKEAEIMEDGDAANVLIGLRESRFRFQMPKTKTVARKLRKSSNRAGSSSEPSHYPRNLKVEHKSKYDAVLEKKRLKPNVIPNWGLIARYGLVSSFDNFFKDNAWRNLLSIEEEGYQALSYEFIATFKIAFPRAAGLQNSVSFYCQGRYHKLEMRQFIKCLKIYDDDFVDSEEFAQLPDSFTNELRADTAWSMIGHGTYNSSVSKGSQLKDPAARVLHYILARSTNGRGDSEGVVSMMDVYQLWSMITGTRVNVGLAAAWCLKKQCDMGHNVVFIGPWITRILKSWDVFSLEAPGDSIGRSTAFIESPLRLWHFVPVDPVAHQPGKTPPLQPERRDLAGSIMQLQSDVAELRRIQKGDSRRIKRLKTYLVDCMTAIGEKLGVTLPPCSSSSDEDMVLRATQVGSGGSRPWDLRGVADRTPLVGSPGSGSVAPQENTDEILATIDAHHEEATEILDSDATEVLDDDDRTP